MKEHYGLRLYPFRPEGEVFIFHGDVSLEHGVRKDLRTYYLHTYPP